MVRGPARRAARQGAGGAGIAVGAAGGGARRASTACSSTPGFDWRGAGCSMCLAMNQDRLEGPRDLRLLVEPQLQGPAGQPDRAHAAHEPGDGRGGRRRRRDRRRAGRSPAMAIEKITRDQRHRAAAARRQHRHRSHHSGAVPASRSRSKGWRNTCSRTIASRLMPRPGTHPISNRRYAGSVDPAGERELRLRLVARARAAGDPALGHPRGRRRVVLGDLLRQLGRARPAVLERVERGHGGADGAGRSATRHCALAGHRAERSAGGGVTATVTLPPAARESFLDGTWDATGMLLDRFEEVERSRPGCRTSAGGSSGGLKPRSASVAGIPGPTCTCRP